MADPAPKIDGDGGEENEPLFVQTPVPPAAAGPAGNPPVIDVDDESRVYLASVEREVDVGEVFPTLRAAYSAKLKEIRNMLFPGRERRIATLKRQIHDAYLGTGSADCGKRYFVTSATTTWSSLLRRAKATLENEVTDAEGRQEEYPRPDDAEHFEDILRLRRKRLRRIGKLIEQADSYVKELQNKSPAS